VSKRVLIIGYNLVDANMGSIRLQRIARLLPRFGWEAVGLTHPPDPAANPGAWKDLRREEVAALNLTHLYSKMRHLRGGVSEAARKEPASKATGLSSQINRWFMIPDRYITWYRPALQRARELLRHEKFDAIFASLDPRTCILLAARLSKETGIPCILEYRDLWTGNPYHHVTQPTRLHGWLHERLERKALRQARRVTSVCRGIADYLSQKHSSVLSAPIELNYNFFDPEEYPAPGPVPTGSRPFIVSYAGAMYGKRSPHSFFEGLRLFLDRSKLTPEQFRFRWAGSISGIDDLNEVLDRTGVRRYMDFLGLISHREALSQLMQSDAALLIQAPNDAIHIPGKLFEAMGARVPLLALAHPCEVADIINRCGAGIICPHTAATVESALAEFHRRFTQGTRWEFNEAEVQRFSATNSVGRLAELLEHAAS
jgi:glycosyltransferase involved in cell wall biosynthesis